MPDNPNFHANLTEDELQARIAKLTIEIPKDRQLTRDDLPSKSDLKELLQLRGEEALLCYAWRNALRALPFIAVQPLYKTWGGNAIRHSFTVVRTVVMAQVYLLGNQITHDMNFNLLSYLAFDVADKSYTYADEAADKAASEENANDAYAYAYESSWIISMVADALSHLVVLDYVFSAARHCANLSAIQSVSILQNVIDFNILSEKGAPAELEEGGLWLEYENDGITKGTFEEIKAWNQQLTTCYTALEDIGLGFLVKDLKKAYQGTRLSTSRIWLYDESSDYDEVLLNDAEALTAIYEQGAETEVNPRVRVMLVGPGGAGKTSLFQLLTQREAKQQNNATVAINTAEVDLAVHTEALPELEDVKLDMTLWDFSGQSVFYNLHRGFMRNNNCVYVLVVDSRHEQAPDDWLAQIEHYAQSGLSQEANTGKPRALVVTNEHEQVKRFQNKRSLLRRFKGLFDSLDFFEFNCTTAQSAEFDRFLKTLVIASINSQKRIMQRTVQGLERLREDFSTKHAVSITELATYFGKKLTGGAFQREREDLENLGFIVNLKHSKHQENHHYCLDPRWITKVAYQALNHPLLTEKSGLINLDEFRDFVLSEITQSGEKNDVVAFLSVQKVVHSFELNGLSYLFFPDAASAEEPAIIEESLLACHTDKNLVTIECSLPAFPMGLKSFLAIELIENKERLLKFAENPKQSYPAQVEVWRDGLWARFVNGVDIVLFYHVAKQKVELKCLYPQELSQNVPNKDEHEQYWQQFPEFLLSEPLNYLYCLIQLHVNTDVVPVLTDNLDRLDQQRRSAMFHDIKDYKIMQPENSKVIHAKNYFEGKVGNAIHNEQNNTANQGTVNAIQGDNATQTIDHSQHQSSSISGSFNRTELPALSPLEKQVLFQGIQLFRETHLSAFDKAQQPQLEKIIDEVCEVVESDTAEPKSEQSGKLLKGIWSRIKDVKDAVEIATLLQQGAQWLF